MPRTVKPRDGLDPLTGELVAALQANREEAVRAWSEACDRYSRYMLSLAAANAELWASGMEAAARRVASFPSPDGATLPPFPD